MQLTSDKVTMSGGNRDLFCSLLYNRATPQGGHKQQLINGPHKNSFIWRPDFPGSENSIIQDLCWNTVSYCIYVVVELNCNVFVLLLTVRPCLNAAAGVDHNWCSSISLYSVAVFVFTFTDCLLLIITFCLYLCCILFVWLDTAAVHNNWSSDWGCLYWHFILFASLLLFAIVVVFVFVNVL